MAGQEREINAVRITRKIGTVTIYWLLAKIVKIAMALERSELSVKVKNGMNNRMKTAHFVMGWEG